MIKTQYEAERTLLENGVVRSLLVHNEKLMMVRFDFRAGAVGEPHAHDAHDQVGYILSGKFEVSCGAETRTIEAGDSYIAAPGILHGVRCLEAGSILDVFTPAREEFLAQQTQG